MGSNPAPSRSNLERELPFETVALLRRTGELAEETGTKAHLVGGLVRDMFLGVRSLDLDVSLEGDGIAFSRRLGKALAAKVVYHERFLTATLTLDDKTRIDVATARAETYSHPGALPDVKPADIGQDLMRRDFTVNAMAIALNPDKFGNLVDPYGGVADLETRTLRVLHPRSFVDDPTRILRLSRFAARFNFAVEPRTQELLDEALAVSVFDSLSGDRLRWELSMFFDEPDPAGALDKLAELRILDEVMPGAKTGKEFAELMNNVNDLVSFVESGPARNRSLIGFLLLLREARMEDVTRVVNRLKFSGDALAAIGLAPRLRGLARCAGDAASMGELHAVVGALPFSVLLAMLVLVGSEKARQRVFEYLICGRNAKPELSGDDLLELGYASGPGLKRILDALVRARLDGEVKSRKQEESYVREHFVPPDAEANA